MTENRVVSRRPEGEIDDPLTEILRSGARLLKNRETLLTFFDFPAEHLRTLNPIESVFATVRHRTVRMKGALSQDTARLMVFNRNSPHSSGSDARISQFGAFDKADASWRAPPEPKVVDGGPKPLLRRGIWTNCLPSGCTSPVGWLKLMTRERLMPWTPRAAARRSAIIRRMSANRVREWRPRPSGR